MAAGSSIRLLTFKEETMCPKVAHKRRPYILEFSFSFISSDRIDRMLSWRLNTITEK